MDFGGRFYLKKIIVKTVMFFTTPSIFIEHEGNLIIIVINGYRNSNKELAIQDFLFLELNFEWIAIASTAVMTSVDIVIAIYPMTIEEILSVSQVFGGSIMKNRMI